MLNIDKPTSQFVLRRSIKTNVEESLKSIKLALSQFKAVTAIDDLRQDRELLTKAETYLVEGNRFVAVSENIAEDL